ncbi:MAG: metal ABC transporter ATP-binding protein [Planctomycetota bacterium]
MSCGYGRRLVLSKVSLSISRGEVVALVGPNGAGKTTLLRVLLGLLRPRDGRIETDRSKPPRAGYVPQVDVSEVLFPVTSLEVVVMGLTPSLGLLARPGRHAKERAREALDRLDVQDLAGRPFRELSGGQRQRVLLARGLVADPELLVLDEPVRGLDFASSAALVTEILDLAREHDMGVVVATHSLDLVANHADQVALFKDGEVTAGPADEIMTSEVLTTFHGRPVEVHEVGGQRVVVPGTAS